MGSQPSTRYKLTDRDMMDEKKRDNGPKIAIAIVAIVAIVVLILFLIYAYSVGLTASFM